MADPISNNPIIPIPPTQIIPATSFGTYNPYTGQYTYPNGLGGYETSAENVPPGTTWLWSQGELPQQDTSTASWTSPRNVSISPSSATLTGYRVSSPVPLPNWAFEPKSVQYANLPQAQQQAAYSLWNVSQVERRKKDFDVRKFLEQGGTKIPTSTRMKYEPVLAYQGPSEKAPSIQQQIQPALTGEMFKDIAKGVGEVTGGVAQIVTPSEGVTYTIPAQGYYPSGTAQYNPITRQYEIPTQIKTAVTKEQIVQSAKGLGYGTAAAAGITTGFLFGGPWIGTAVATPFFKSSVETLRESKSPVIGAAAEFLPTSPVDVAGWYGIGRVARTYPKIVSTAFTGLGIQQYTAAETPKEKWMGALTAGLGTLGLASEVKEISLFGIRPQQKVLTPAEEIATRPFSRQRPTLITRDPNTGKLIFGKTKTGEIISPGGRQEKMWDDPKVTAMAEKLEEFYGYKPTEINKMSASEITKLYLTKGTAPKYIGDYVTPEETFKVFTSDLKDLNLKPSSDIRKVVKINPKSLFLRSRGQTSLQPIDRWVPFVGDVRAYEAGIINFVRTGEKPTVLELTLPSGDKAVIATQSRYNVAEEAMKQYVGKTLPLTHATARPNMLKRTNFFNTKEIIKGIEPSKKGEAGDFTIEMDLISPKDYALSLVKEGTIKKAIKLGGIPKVKEVIEPTKQFSIKPGERGAAQGLHVSPPTMAETPFDMGFSSGNVKLVEAETGKPFDMGFSSGVTKPVEGWKSMGVKEPLIPSQFVSSEKPPAYIPLSYMGFGKPTTESIKVSFPKRTVYLFNEKVGDVVVPTPKTFKGAYGPSESEFILPPNTMVGLPEKYTIASIGLKKVRIQPAVILTEAESKAFKGKVLSQKEYYKSLPEEGVRYVNPFSAGAFIVSRPILIKSSKSSESVSLPKVIVPSIPSISKGSDSSLPVSVSSTTTKIRTPTPIPPKSSEPPEKTEKLQYYIPHRPTRTPGRPVPSYPSEPSRTSTPYIPHKPRHGISKRRKKEKEIMPKEKGYLVLTYARKKPVLISQKPLIKSQAIGLGVSYTKGTERATFKLVPTTREPVKSTIKPIQAQETFKMGYRTPVRRGKAQPLGDVFIQRRPTRLGTQKEIMAVQAYKRGKTIW